MKTELSYEQKIELLEDPNCPQNLLELLATDENYWVRARVAQNPNTTEYIQRLIIMTNANQ